MYRILHLFETETLLSMRVYFFEWSAIGLRIDRMQVLGLPLSTKVLRLLLGMCASAVGALGSRILGFKVSIDI